MTCVMSGFTTLEFVIRPIMLGVVLMMVIAYIMNALRKDPITGMSND